MIISKLKKDLQRSVTYIFETKENKKNYSIVALLTILTRRTEELRYELIDNSYKHTQKTSYFLDKGA